MTAMWKCPAALLVTLPLIVAAGCPQMPEKILPLAQIVAAHNANAENVPHLWARARIQATFRVRLAGDEGDMVPITWGSTSSLASPNGLLLMAKGPDPAGQSDFVLIGRETAAVELFRVGASLEEGVYYFWYSFGDRRGAFWGRNDRADAMANRGMPVNPHDLMAVLNISMMPNDFTKLPTVAVTMRTAPPEYAYVVSYIDRDPDTQQILFRREMLFTWSDTDPPRPFEVNFFDARGLRVMTAKLKNYQSIADASSSDGRHVPVMPTDIEITWPAEKSRMHIVLSEISTKQVSPAAFRYSDHAPDLPADREIQIDAGIPVNEAAP